MSQKLKGNTKGLAPSQLRSAERLFTRKLDPDQIINHEVARELFEVASYLGRRVGLLVSREGRIEEVFIGTREILYLPELGRYRFGKGRLRRLRLVYSDLSRDEKTVQIPADIYGDLEKLRLDMVCGVKVFKNSVLGSFAHLVPVASATEAPIMTEETFDLARSDVQFRGFIEQLEQQLEGQQVLYAEGEGTRALLVGVYGRDVRDPESSLLELRELARTAGLTIAGEVIQRRQPDPRTLLGKGKLEQVTLQCLRLGAEMIIFDRELKPFQWRVITNSTELKVIDRSMLILDIFAQRATSSDGRLQVELAQLKYNLPRLVEKDAGLSRLTGEIGGRGPGETKLEIERRRARDRIHRLEKRIKKFSKQRALQRSRRRSREIPLVAILGYTNAGKSTLFNALTTSDVFVENKLFATLDPAHRRLVIPQQVAEDDDLQPEDYSTEDYGLPVVISDTVGFIRELPNELLSAFRATLEELYDASVLIHVIDGSDPAALEHKRSVEKILAEMDLLGIPRIMVVNKRDLLTDEEAARVCLEFEAIGVSAVTKQGFDQLLEIIAQTLDDDSRQSEHAEHA